MTSNRFCAVNHLAPRQYELTCNRNNYYYTACIAVLDLSVLKKKKKKKNVIE